MAPKLTCPSCGLKGRSDDDDVFETKGAYKSRPLRHCRRCAADFTVPIFGSPKQLTYAESIALIEQRMDRQMNVFLRLGNGHDVAGAENDEVDEEERGVADINRDALIKRFHECTGAQLVHDDSSGGHEWLTVSALKPQPPDGPETEEIIRAYGMFSIALLAAEGRAMMLKRFEIPRTESGPVWKQNREERWTSYTRYASNVVLIRSNEVGARQLDSRWERLDECLSSLRAV